jgi:hypothetical protein
VATPWSRVLLEKLVVVQLVKKFPTFYRTRKVNYRVHKSQPPGTILSQMNPVHNLTSYVLNIGASVTHWMPYLAVPFCPALGLSCDIQRVGNPLSSERRTAWGGGHDVKTQACGRDQRASRSSANLSRLPDPSLNGSVPNFSVSYSSLLHLE